MKKVVLVVAFLFVIVTISPIFNVEYAKLTDNGKGAFGGGGINNVVDMVLSATIGPIGTALSSVVLLLVGLFALILASVFGPVMGTWGFPSIDQIVFNKVALFDPNFMDVSNTGLVSFNGIPAIQSLIKQVYTTGYVVAGSIFVIGAMVIGIKLAITSIASERAYYKELVGQWLKSLVLLFTVHILVAGVFYLNELVVQKIYESANPSGIHFQTPMSSLGYGGKVVSTLIGGWNELWGKKAEEPTIGGDGIGGLIVVLLLKAVLGGDIISAVAVAGLLGQTCSLCITYFKRVIVCIVLAALAPYIVAVDFVKKLL